MRDERETLCTKALRRDFSISSNRMYMTEIDLNSPFFISSPLLEVNLSLVYKVLLLIPFSRTDSNKLCVLKSVHIE